MQSVAYDVFRSRQLWTGVTAMIAVGIAASWLLVVFLVDGINLLKGIKFKLQQASVVQMQSIAGILRRSAELSEHVDLLAIYATPEFLATIRSGEHDIRFAPEGSLIFIINEDTHVDSLRHDPTPAVLRIDGKEMYSPEKAETLSYSNHHKVSVLSFPKQDLNGRPIASDSTSSLELLVPKEEGSAFAVLRWDLPITYPKEVLRGQHVPFGTMLALTGGLLATVLTPCLIQMVLYYLSTLTGLSAEMPSAQALSARAKSRVLKVALGFVSGFTILFTGVGALAGLAGETLQGSGLWAAWTRPLAASAGVVIVLLGLWTAIRARSPLVCRLSLPKFAQPRETGFFRSTLMGFSFALGCSTCFGGALIATLLFYVGTLGSPTEGALVLFFFSLGVGVPFLLAAVLLSRVLPLMNSVERAAPIVGLVSSLVMVGFGLLLITDNFHLVSTWIHNWIDRWLVT